MQRLPAKAGGKDVGQQQGGALVLVAKDVEQQRQALADELSTVVIRADLQKVLQQLIDDRIQAQLMCRRQRVHPAVQGPGHAQLAQLDGDVYTG